MHDRNTQGESTASTQSHAPSGLNAIRKPVLALIILPWRLLAWAALLAWRLATLRQRRRVAAEAAAEHRRQAARDEEKARRQKEAAERERANDLTAMLNILEAIDFNDGTSRKSGKYLPISELIEKADQLEKLRRKLGESIPPRPREGVPEDSLWQSIGGKSPDSEDAISNLLEGGDQGAQDAASEILIRIRRELHPRVDPDKYIKSAAELAARVRVRSIPERIRPPHIEADFLRGYERRARWILTRRMKPGSVSGSRKPAPRRPPEER